MKRYHLHKRNDVWYAQIIDQATGSRLSAKSTGKTDRDEAVVIVNEWLKSGIPTGAKQKKRPVELAVGFEAIMKAITRSSLDSDQALSIVYKLKEMNLVDIPVVKHQRAVLFLDFLAKFWDYDKSPYIREKLAHKHMITKRHCKDMQSRLTIHWMPEFQGRTLASITREDIKNFSLTLADKGLASSSINKTLCVGTSALSWAFREGQLPTNPCKGITKFVGKPQKPGVLSVTETNTVFNTAWPDSRSYVGNLLAATTGMRSGEVLAVKLSDIEGDILNVNHSWNTVDGLKCPKNGEERRVPLLPQVKECLYELAKTNPWGKDGFLFYSTLKDKPMDAKVLVEGLHDTLDAVGVDWRNRKIVFHSWRHFYAARMTDIKSAEEVARVTGHKSMAVFEEYADHVERANLDEMGKAAQQVFNNIVVLMPQGIRSRQ
jgi:integrase